MTVGPVPAVGRTAPGGATTLARSVRATGVGAAGLTIGLTPAIGRTTRLSGAAPAHMVRATVPRTALPDARPGFVTSARAVHATGSRAAHPVAPARRPGRGRVVHRRLPRARAVAADTAT
ncbi:hypothetical protein, partial [Streptomyces sp. NPDC020667]|uniref:hypothetical protein n=1 Tax=Streptomyces sp. NPDC020667 TaxID=3154895 RepID=UPI0033DCEFA8